MGIELVPRKGVIVPDLYLREISFTALKLKMSYFFESQKNLKCLENATYIDVDGDMSSFCTEDEYEEENMYKLAQNSFSEIKICKEYYDKETDFELVQNACLGLKEGEAFIENGENTYITVEDLKFEVKECENDFEKKSDCELAQSPLHFVLDANGSDKIQVEKGDIFEFVQHALECGLEGHRIEKEGKVQKNDCVSIQIELESVAEGNENRLLNKIKKDTFGEATFVKYRSYSDFLGGDDDVVIEYKPRSDSGDSVRVPRDVSGLGNLNIYDLEQELIKSEFLEVENDEENYPEKYTRRKRVISADNQLINIQPSKKMRIEMIVESASFTDLESNEIRDFEKLPIERDLFNCTSLEVLSHCCCNSYFEHSQVNELSTQGLRRKLPEFENDWKPSKKMRLETIMGTELPSISMKNKENTVTHSSSFMKVVLGDGPVDWMAQESQQEKWAAILIH
eukprot:NODE_156_length_15158_cov_0.791553.p3 type:complete len:454 gc:universal NODE_156_length_15158_cov_0.791553:4744-6105(+)